MFLFVVKFLQKKGLLQFQCYGKEETYIVVSYWFEENYNAYTTELLCITFF